MLLYSFAEFISSHVSMTAGFLPLPFSVDIQHFKKVEGPERQIKKNVKRFIHRIVPSKILTMEQKELELVN